MTAIRRATAQDLPALVAMGLQFLAQEYAGAIVGDAAHVAAMAARLVDAGAMQVLETRGGDVVGMIGMVVYDHFLSGERIASPLCWWVTPAMRRGRDGLRLFNAGIAWATMQGATRLQTSAPNAITERIYQRLGLERFEVHYQRRLP